MCSSKVVKGGGAYYKPPNIQAIRKVTRTFEEEKGSLDPPKITKAVSTINFYRCVQAVFCPALLVCSCFFILNRKRKMFVLAESWVVSSLDSVSTDGVCVVKCS